MALAITVPVAVLVNTTDVDTYTFAAFTPSASSLIFCFSSAYSTAVQPIISGGSLTWYSLINLIPAGTKSINLFYAFAPTSPVSTTVQLVYTADAATGCAGIIYQVTGYNTSNPLVQWGNKSTTAANPNLNLARNMNTNNGYIGYFSSNTNPPTSTPPASWTEDADTGFATPTTGITAAHRINGETGNSITFTAASSAYDLMFVEINEATQSNPRNLSALGAG